MTRKTVYYDAFLCGLIPVQPLALVDVDGYAMVKVRVSRTTRHYRAGEVFNVPRRCVVEKTHRRSGFQYVRTADLSARNLPQTVSSNW